MATERFSTASSRLYALARAVKGRVDEMATLCGARADVFQVVYGAETLHEACAELRDGIEEYFTEEFRDYLRATALICSAISPTQAERLVYAFKSWGRMALEALADALASMTAAIRVMRSQLGWFRRFWATPDYILRLESLKRSIQAKQGVIAVLHAMYYDVHVE